MSLYEQYPVSIYNSLNKQKEVFKPIHEGRVGMYVCGPTVYSDVHLGNVRTFVSFDIMFRYLLYLGYKVRYVRNITDVGHLVGDADEGEDKIAKKARLEELEPMEIVQKYTNGFHDVMRLFNALPPSIEPTATGHIVEQIEFIKQIIANGYAYEKDGSVYFDVRKYNKDHQYGELSGRNIDEMLSNTRELTGQDQKNDPLDFALWKKAEKNHLMRWNSPWGEGFPGWHLECTAMSKKYLGDEFDIHGGGIDLKFPHHDCEIAQCVGHTGKQPAKFWMHANMLTLNNKKMSKSTGNNILPNELFSGNNEQFSKPYDPNIVRFFFLQANYRSELDISESAIQASEKGFNRLIEIINRLSLVKTVKTKNDKLLDTIKKWENNCYDCLNDDFNTPMLLAEIFNSNKIINDIENDVTKISQVEKNYFINLFDIFLNKILGLNFKKDKINNDSVLEILLKLRDNARKHKDYKLSDSIRDELAKIGININDKD